MHRGDRAAANAPKSRSIYVSTAAKNPNVRLNRSFRDGYPRGRQLETQAMLYNRAGPLAMIFLAGRPADRAPLFLKPLPPPSRATQFPFSLLRVRADVRHEFWKVRQRGGVYRNDSNGLRRIADTAGNRPPRSPMTSVNSTAAASVLPSTTIRNETRLMAPSLVSTTLFVVTPFAR